MSRHIEFFDTKSDVISDPETKAQAKKYLLYFVMRRITPNLLEEAGVIDEEITPATRQMSKFMQTDVRASQLELRLNYAQYIYESQIGSTLIHPFSRLSHFANVSRGSITPGDGIEIRAVDNLLVYRAQPNWVAHLKIPNYLGENTQRSFDNNFGILYFTKANN